MSRAVQVWVMSCLLRGKGLFKKVALGAVIHGLVWCLGFDLVLFF